MVNEEVSTRTIEEDEKMSLNAELLFLDQCHGSFDHICIYPRPAQPQLENTSLGN